MLFRSLIGAVFLPLAAVVLADWYIVRRIRGGASGAGFSVTEPDAPTWRYLLVWVFGVCVYSTISPAQVPGWSGFWEWIATRVPWLTNLGGSATVATLALTAAATVAVGVVARD